MCHFTVTMIGKESIQKRTRVYTVEMPVKQSKRETGIVNLTFREHNINSFSSYGFESCVFS